VAVVHDIRCVRCDAVRRDVPIVKQRYPRCECGGRMDWIPFVPKTDVKGGPTWSWACGDYVTSSRERDARMRAKGFEPSGDKVGGARDEGHLNLGKTTSFAGQSVRRTLTRER
jgi:hypothetical protein